MFFLYVIIVLKGKNKNMIIPNNIVPAMLITLFAGLSTAISGGIVFNLSKALYSLFFGVTPKDAFTIFLLFIQ